MSFLELYRGVISGLLGAVFFGAGATVFRRVSEETDVVSMNLFRSILGFLFFIAVVLVIRDLPVILSLSRYVVLMLILSVLFNVVIGDTLYFQAQNYVGVSRAFPITNLRPIFTLFLAHFLLGEALTEQIFVGVLLVIGGVYIVAQPHENESESFKRVRTQIGYVLALLTALCWTGGALAIRVAFSSELNGFSANSIRYAFASLFLWLMSSWKGAKSVQKIGTYNQQTLKWIIIATVFTTFVGTFFWADSIKYVGASKAITLDATSPLFAMSTAVLFLGETFSWKILLGILMTILGIWLVV